MGSMAIGLTVASENRDSRLFCGECFAGRLHDASKGEFLSREMLFSCWGLSIQNFTNGDII